VDFNHQTVHKETAFNSAARHGNVEVLRLLVKLSLFSSASFTAASALDVRSRNKEGCTPFHKAVKSGDLAKVRYLASELELEQPLDKEEPDDSLTTPVHSAVKRGDILMVQLLHSMGCNIHTATSSGVTPLFSAVSHNMYSGGTTH
jgi:ankyrin repeat protein